jgi:hypothetical protein
VTLSPRLLKGGLVQLDQRSGRIVAVVGLQYNPDTLTRSLQVQASGETGDRSQALRLRGAAVETIKLDAEIDATDQMEFPDENVARFGLHPQLAALEILVHPAASQLIANNALAQAGTLEIAPMETPLTLFIWSKSRILPVRLTDFSVTEEAFDPALNPIRAKVSLGMRVLSVDDLGFTHKGGSLFMSYLQLKEQLAARAQGGSLTLLGIERIP